MNIQDIQHQAKRIVNYTELIERKKRYTHGIYQYGFKDPLTGRPFKIESDDMFEARKNNENDKIRWLERRLATAIEDLTKLT